MLTGCSLSRTLRVFAIVAVAIAASSVAQDAKSVALPNAPTQSDLPPDGGPNFNRLVFESSPYLIQHAANPVEWYPWTAEAFELARAEDKPIFLSIGFSTCHWCHVMERESFEDAEVAALLNEHFVCIKVDREERPDIDQVYMAASIATRRSGGWPQSVFMTWDKQPFHMASYIPKASRPNRVGMLELLPQIAEVWKTNRTGILAAAREAVAKLEKFNGGAPGENLDLDTMTKAYKELVARYDSVNGGFTLAPKFPPTHHLSFLLRYWRRTGNENALAMVENTLIKMRRGGVFDHIGYGFHRYATDDRWNVPHFEKMLYDQAMHAMTYAEAFQATGNETYRETARNICDYVLRDLTSPDGAFYAARDADSEGEEGKFYTWTVDEVLKVLGEERGHEFVTAYNFEAGGNYNDQATRERTGSNVPNLKRPLTEIARELGIEPQQLQSHLETSRKNLMKHREQRVPPMLDDTVLADWNGLMTAALARCGQALGEPKYTAAAIRSADFILKNFVTKEGRLLHRYRNGKASNPAHLEDYAFVVWALLEVYEASFEIRFLQNAIDLNDVLLQRFWDDREGGFFMTAHDSESLLIRPKETYDRARPSGNSAAALNLLRIARMTGETELEERALELFRAFARQVGKSPSAFTQLMIALDMAIGPSHEVVIAGTPGAPDTLAMIEALRKAFVPNKVVLFRPDTNDAQTLTSIAPFTANQKTLEGKATAYVCRNYTCNAPTTSIDEMLAALRPESAGESSDQGPQLP